MSKTKRESSPYVGCIMSAVDRFGTKCRQDRSCTPHDRYTLLRLRRENRDMRRAMNDRCNWCASKGACNIVRGGQCELFKFTKGGAK